MTGPTAAALRTDTVATGRVEAVLRGRIAQLTDLQGRVLPSAIDKRPVGGPVRIGPAGVEGDEFGNPASHGTPDQAVYAYAQEEAAWWAVQLGRAIPPGLFGENLHTSGVTVSGAVVGEQWAVGDVLLLVTGPRTPCGKFAKVMGDPDWPRTFRRAFRPGAYFRVLAGGTVRSGEQIRVLDRPAHGVTVADLARVHAGALDPAVLGRVPGLAPKWKALLTRSA